MRLKRNRRSDNLEDTFNRGVASGYSRGVDWALGVLGLSMAELLDARVALARSGRTIKDLIAEATGTTNGRMRDESVHGHIGKAQKELSAQLSAVQAEVVELKRLFSPGEKDETETASPKPAPADAWKLTAVEQAVYRWFVKHADKDGLVRISQRELRRMMGTHAWARSTLQQKGILRVIERAVPGIGGHGATYWVRSKEELCDRM